MINVEIKGVKKLESRLKKHARKANEETSKAVVRGALLIEGDMKTLIAKGARTGRAYALAGGGFRIASAPGEPPKTDTGHLVKSISHNKITVFEYDVVAIASYASDLEFGTFKTEPRPFVKPTVKKNRAKIENDIRQSLKKGLK